jgi:hypothetical protein
VIGEPMLSLRVKGGRPMTVHPALAPAATQLVG